MSQKQGKIVPRNSGKYPLHPDYWSQIRPSELSCDKPGMEPANPQVDPQEDPEEPTTLRSSSTPGRQTPLVRSHAHKTWQNSPTNAGPPSGVRSAQIKHNNIPAAWQYLVSVRPDSTPSQRNNPLYGRLVNGVMINYVEATSRECGPTSNGELLGGERNLQTSSTMKPTFERGKTAYHSLKTIHLEKMTKTRQIIAL